MTIMATWMKMSWLKRLWSFCLVSVFRLREVDSELFHRQVVICEDMGELKRD